MFIRCLYTADAFKIKRFLTQAYLEDVGYSCYLHSSHKAGKSILTFAMVAPYLIFFLDWNEAIDVLNGL